MRLLKRFKWFFVLLIFTLPSYGQDNTKSVKDIVDQLTPLAKNPDQLKEMFYESLKNALNDPSTLNFVLKEILGKGSAAGLLKDLNMKFKTFKFDDTSAIGLTYDFNKVIKENTISGNSIDKTGLALDLSSSGNIVLTNDPNPFNYLKSSLAFHFYKSIGGAVEVTDAVSRELTNMQLALARINDIDSLKSSKLWKDYLNVISQNLTNQFYFDFSLDAAIESNQDFTLKNYTYGAKLGIDIKAWNSNSTLANLNVFDWPFAITRWFTGTENNIYPRGSTIPTLLAKVDLVDPQKDPARKGAGKLEMYPRLGFEAAFKTLVAEANGEQIYFTADLRYFKELDASDAVKKMNIDEQFYFTMSLTQKQGLYVRYTTGKLPLDQRNNDAYAIGWKVDF